MNKKFTYRSNLPKGFTKEQVNEFFENAKQSVLATMEHPPGGNPKEDLKVYMELQADYGEEDVKSYVHINQVRVLRNALVQSNKVLSDPVFWSKLGHQEPLERVYEENCKALTQTNFLQEKE